MPQPNPLHRRNLRSQGIRPADIDQLLEVIRVLDRSVLEISMHIYRVPRHQRVVMREQHRRLHETIRKRLPRLVRKQT